MSNNIKVYVGMSGGVDSSLAASLLVEQGYDVTGVFMKNWTMDLPGVKCPWADDLADAKRVAVQLGIDFKVFDFENEYRQKVVDYMIDEYKKGHTPNPDIMCNQEVKFKLFLNAALADGADMIATGHYARVGNKFTVTHDLSTSAFSKRLRSTFNEGPGALLNLGCRGFEKVDADILSSYGLVDNSADVYSEHLQPEFDKAPGPLSDPARSRSEKTTDESSKKTGRLLRAVDDNKDQTYFLYRVTSEAMARTLFPIGGFTKPQVRQMAAERNLTTAIKKDSQGICFVGQVGIREFLSMYVDLKIGNIIDKKSAKIVGQHDGAIFYTIGQRHGLNIGGGLPYYVAGKDMDKNEVYVTTDLNDVSLWQNQVKLIDVHWINDIPLEGSYKIRIRHRAPLIEAELSYCDDGVFLKLKDAERSIASGQSIVIYDDQICLGGGIIV